MADLNVIKEQIKSLKPLEAVELIEDVLEGRLEPKENFTLEERMALAEFDLENAKDSHRGKRVLRGVVFSFVAFTAGLVFSVSTIASMRRQWVAAEARKPKPPEDPTRAN